MINLSKTYIKKNYKRENLFTTNSSTKLNASKL